MRTARLLAVLLVLLSAGLLLAPGTPAQQPFRLSDYVTDNAGALSGAGHGAVESAVNKLYADRHVRLWVVYVDDFSG
ncbi:MAG: TPM domain-containing protein, partial [Mycobacterium sp.]